MSIYSKNESGTQRFRTRMPRMSYRYTADCDFGYLYPVFRKFVLPGDVWKVGANLLVRYQPTLAPILNSANARIRYFFVPLRLIESNTEKVITGSDNGKVVNGELPVFPKIFEKVTDDSNFVVQKHSFADYLGMPCIDYKNIKNDKTIPASYWQKGYLRIYYDYYRDENINSSDFENLCNTYQSRVGRANSSMLFVNLAKDYFTSALPFQLKGPIPTFDIIPSGLFTPNSIIGLSAEMSQISYPSGTLPQHKIGSVIPKLTSSTDVKNIDKFSTDDSDYGFKINGTSVTDFGISTDDLNNFFGGNGTFNADDIRTIMAQTRIFERLARCGSRYTEYLNANFGLSPADGTLQRAQYLGGFKQPIVTTEVLQTAEDSVYPVGTMRGHGISNSSNMIKPFVAKEFGIIMGLLDIMPEIQYTQGIDRELCFTERFDFFNPSFQHMSEQEVRNGELFMSSDDGLNDNTFGFQGIYNELRQSRSFCVGDMRDNLKYWNQAIEFQSRPNLNNLFLRSIAHLGSFKKPFAVQDSSALPCIVDCYNLVDVYRPMVKYATPGLVDHY